MIENKELEIEKITESFVKDILAENEKLHNYIMNKLDDPKVDMVAMTTSFNLIKQQRQDALQILVVKEAKIKEDKK